MASYFKEFMQKERIYHVGEEGYEVIYYPNGEVSKPYRMGKLANEQLKVYDWFERTLSKAVNTRNEFYDLNYKFGELGYDSFKIKKDLYLSKPNPKPQELKNYIIDFERQHWLTFKG